VEIACQNGITSKYTSFVAIDVKEDKPSAENWVMETRNVPSQFAHGWHGGRMGTAMPMRTITSSSPSPMFKGGAICKKRSKRSSNSPPVAMSGSLSSSTFGSSSVPVLGNIRRSVRSAVSDFSEMEVEAEDTPTPVIQLISLQSFDGSYTLTEKIAAIVGKSLDEIKNGASKGNLQEQVFVTALAISFFLTKLSAEKDVWELIVMKARKWLAKAIQPEQVDAAIQTATTFLEA